jgi:hypothetical protein
MEDRAWFYVGVTRAARETRFCDVVHPEPRAAELELDLPMVAPTSMTERLAGSPAATAACNWPSTRPTQLRWRCSS